MPAIEVTIPTLHPDQVKAFMLPARFKAVRCGRRWGKTDLGKTIASDAMIKGELVGWFAPDHKTWVESFNEIVDICDPIVRTSSIGGGVIRAKTRGRIDFWTLENDRAGRSRKYNKVIIDEGAFTKPNMMDIWEKSIKPTLLDYKGTALVLSNTNGIDPENFFWRICNQPEHRFKEYHAPSHNNPYLPADELERLKRDNHPLVYAQEYLADFVDWAGVAFFAEQSMLVEGAPCALPARCDGVFAVIDTAVKTGRENDGTAVSYWAITKHGGHPLVLLDWETLQIEGSLLETWLPTVFQNLNHYAQVCKARVGSLGAHIEDKSSGSILLQQSLRRGWSASPIDSKLTAVGKDERAISVSGYVYRGMVKLSKPAYDKVTTYKGTTRNHFLAQVLGFRIGDKDGTREDDLLDTFCYAIAIALGNAEGY
jgi:hypothetical protein